MSLFCSFVGHIFCLHYWAQTENTPTFQTSDVMLKFYKKKLVIRNTYVTRNAFNMRDFNLLVDSLKYCFIVTFEWKLLLKYYRTYGNNTNGFHNYLNNGLIHKNISNLRNLVKVKFHNGWIPPKLLRNCHWYYSQIIKLFYKLN